MWLNPRSFGKGKGKEAADVLGGEGTKVTNMKPITEKGRQREAGASNTHLRHTEMLPMAAGLCAPPRDTVGEAGQGPCPEQTPGVCDFWEHLWRGPGYL